MCTAARIARDCCGTLALRLQRLADHRTWQTRCMVRLCRCACICASVCRSSTTTRTTSTCQSPGNISYLACCRVGMMSEQQGSSHSCPSHPTYGRSVKSSPPPTSEKCGFTELWISDVAPNVVSSIGRLWWPARSTRPSGRSWPLNINGCNYPRSMPTLGIVSERRTPSPVVTASCTLASTAVLGLIATCRISPATRWRCPPKSCRTTTPCRSN